MKKILLITLALSLTGIINAKTFKVNAKKSRVDWYAKKVGSKHNGTITIKKTVLIKNGNHFSGTIIIDMNSIKVLNIKDPKYNAKLTGHLKSEDFFATKKFPDATLVIKSAKKKSNNIYVISGGLTIRDKTNPVSFPVTIKFNKKGFIATGKLTIDRSKYNVKYGSGSFFKNLGDKLIYNDFDIKFTLVGK